MGQYISKSILTAEIKRIKSILGNPFCLNDTTKASWVARKDVCEDLLSFINSTEVKEVDLDEEIESYFKGFRKFASVGIDDCIDIARYFFELGMKMAQKGE